MFFAETKVSSRSSSAEVYRDFFVFWVLQCLDGTVSAREDTPLRPTLEPKCPKNPTSGRNWAARLRQARTLMYIRGTRQRRYLHAVPPKRCAESSQMASVAPPARIWDDSPADSCTFRRRRRLRRYALPPPERTARQFRGGGCTTGVLPKLGYSSIQTRVPRSGAPHGRLLDKKYFSPKQRCHRVVQVQKSIENFLFSGYCSVWMAPSAHARTPPCGQLWSQNVQKNQPLDAIGPHVCARRAR